MNYRSERDAFEAGKISSAPNLYLTNSVEHGYFEDGSSLPLPLRLLVFLEEDKGSDHDVLAAGSVVGRGWVDAGSVERPARDGTIGDRIVALEHRDLGGLLLWKPVPLVVGAVGEAGGLADAVVVD